MRTVELPVCSFGGQRADVENLIPLYMALEGPQWPQHADSRQPMMGARQLQTGPSLAWPDPLNWSQTAPDGTRSLQTPPGGLQMATDCSRGAPGCSKWVPDSPQPVPDSPRGLQNVGHLSIHRFTLQFNIPLFQSTIPVHSL